MTPRSSARLVISRPPSRFPPRRTQPDHRRGPTVEPPTPPGSSLAGLLPELRSRVLQWVLPMPGNAQEAVTVRPKVPPVALTCHAFRDATLPVAAAALWLLIHSDDEVRAQLGALPIDRFLPMTNHLPPDMGIPPPVDRLRILIGLALAPWQNARTPDALDWVLQETPVRCEVPPGVPIEARAMALQITVEHACADDRDLASRDVDAFELLDICVYHLGCLLDIKTPHPKPVALQQALVDIALLMPYGPDPDRWAIEMDHQVLIDWAGLRRLAAQAGLDPALFDRLPAIAQFIAVEDLHDPWAPGSEHATAAHTDAALSCLLELPAPYTTSLGAALVCLGCRDLSPAQRAQLALCLERDPRWRAPA